MNTYYFDESMISKLSDIYDNKKDYKEIMDMVRWRFFYFINYDNEGKEISRDKISN